MYEKAEREYNREFSKQMAIEHRREEAKWSPVDKEDAKWRAKQAHKAAAKRNSGQKKALKRMLEEEDDTKMVEGQKKQKITSAWKKRG